jgi:hypothetical protein
MAATLITFQIKSNGKRENFSLNGKYDGTGYYLNDALQNGKVTHIARTPPDNNGTFTVTVAVEH